MSPKLRRASQFAVIVTAVAAFASASVIAAQPGTAQIKSPAEISLPVATAGAPSDLINGLEVIPQKAEPAILPNAVEPDLNAPLALQPAQTTTLAGLVTAQPQPAELARELNCLAGAIYFEAKSESLSGQLAVGRVVVARSKSGRFPNSYCGVVFQPSQFSFVRGNGMPGIQRASRQWHNAVAIAQIAHAGSWRSPVEGALYFHAARVSPAWRLTRIARVENHIFYR